MLFARSHCDDKKKPPILRDRWLFFVFHTRRALLLVSLSLQQFALLVLAHLLATFLDHASHYVTSFNSADYVSYRF